MAAALPSVVWITDWSVGEAALLARLAPLLAAARGAFAVQHRDPASTTRRFFERGQTLSALCAAHGAPLFVNGRLEVALALRAHLHLPVRALAPSQVRPHLPAGTWVSVAVHDVPGEAQRSVGADFALLSPVFAPRSKPGDLRPTLGPAGFAGLAAKVSCPAFALGGISPQNAAALGASGVALMTTVLHQVDDVWAQALLASMR